MFTRRQFLLGVAGAAVSARSLFTTRPAGAGTPTAAAGGGIVSLTGDARTVGRRFGELNAERIRHCVRRFLDSCGKRGLSDKNIMERSRPFRRFVAKFAPAWMEEITACANAADVPPERYTAYLAGKHRGLFFVDDCTSFCAVGAATADGAALFHKTRDTGAREQSAYKKKIVDASNPAGFHAVGDTTDMGVMMMMNDHGLAGSADVHGKFLEDRPKGRGVMNTEILRLIAERAERCEDALEIVQQMIKDGWYAGGRKYGTHWLFADRFGKALRVAQNSHEERHWFSEDDTVFLARGETAGAKLVTQKKGRITLRDMNAAASHPDICIDASASALTVRVDPHNPAERSSVWTALPAWALYVPLSPTARGVPREIVDGAYFRAGHDLLKLSLRRGSKVTVHGFQRRGIFFPDSLLRRREAVQEALYADAEEVQRKIRAACERGDCDTAAQIATERSLAACAKAMRFIAEVEQREGA